MLKKINLKGKIALVTGAGKGLGKACAVALAEAGAKVIIISRTKSDLVTFGNRCVSYEECEDFAKSLDSCYFELSSLKIYSFIVFENFFYSFDSFFLILF